MTEISSRLYRASTGWLAIGALLVFAAFTGLVLPRQAALAEAASRGQGSPDTSFFYAPDRLYELAEAYGPDGRRAYIRARFTFDIVWPVVYTFFLATSISWVLGNILLPSSRLRQLNLLPFWGAAFDLLENVTASIVFFRYPVPTPGVDLLASASTMLKWGLIGSSFAVLAAGALIGAGRWAGSLSRGRNAN